MHMQTLAAAILLTRFHWHVMHPGLWLIGMMGLGILFLGAVGVILLIAQISKK